MSMCKLILMNTHSDDGYVMLQLMIPAIEKTKSRLGKQTASSDLNPAHFGKPTGSFTKKSSFIAELRYQSFCCPVPVHCD